MRRLWLLVAAVPMLAYCTFPGVRIADDGGADASTDGAEKGDGSGGDGGTDPCDQDHDGHRANTKACGGDDCNDLDSRTHPGADFVHDAPDAGLLGDWNCDGVVEEEYPAVNCGQISTSCSSAMGFDVDPGCGASGHFVQCTGSVVCSGTDAGSRVQGCK